LSKRDLLNIEKFAYVVKNNYFIINKYNFLILQCKLNYKMSKIYQIYLISDSTGETLERIFLALKAQFKNIEYKIHPYSFTRTENQMLKILNDAKKNPNAIILYTIVDNGLAKFLANQCDDRNISGFGIL